MKITDETRKEIIAFAKNVADELDRYGGEIRYKDALILKAAQILKHIEIVGEDAELEEGDAVFDSGFGAAVVSGFGDEEQPICTDINGDDYDLTGSKLLLRANGKACVSEAEINNEA